MDGKVIVDRNGMRLTSTLEPDHGKCASLARPRHVSREASCLTRLAREA